MSSPDTGNLGERSRGVAEPSVAERIRSAGSISICDSIFPATSILAENSIPAAYKATHREQQHRREPLRCGPPHHKQSHRE